MTTSPTPEKLPPLNFENMGRLKDIRRRAATTESYDNSWEELLRASESDVDYLLKVINTLEARAETAERALAEAKAEFLADVKMLQGDLENVNARCIRVERERTEAKAEGAVLAEKWRRYLVVSLRQQGCHLIDAEKSADHDMQQIAPLATAFLLAHTEALKNARTVGTMEMCTRDLPHGMCKIPSPGWYECKWKECPIRAAKGA